MAEIVEGPEDEKNQGRSDIQKNIFGILAIDHNSQDFYIPIIDKAEGAEGFSFNGFHRLCKEHNTKRGGKWG